MKVIKEYGGFKRLKRIQYDCGDFLDFVFKFKISVDTANRLCDYLEKNSLVVDVEDLYDPQSGWIGFTFVIKGVDLSENGFCFTSEKVAKFLKQQG